MTDHTAHAHHGHSFGPWITSPQTTLHGLTGCIIGKVADLVDEVFAGRQHQAQPVLARHCGHCPCRPFRRLACQSVAALP